MPFLPWAQINACLEMVPEWEYKSNYHVALNAYMSASAFGGMKDKQPTDLLAPFARPPGLERNTGDLRLTLKGAEARAFRLGLQRGVISQRLLNLFSSK